MQIEASIICDAAIRFNDITREDYSLRLDTKTETEYLEFEISPSTGFVKSKTAKSFPGVFNISKSLTGNGEEILYLQYKNARILNDLEGNYLLTRETSLVINLRLDYLSEIDLTFVQISAYGIFL